MAKKKSKRRQQTPAVRIEGVLESVVDELATVISVLRAVPDMAIGGSEEIAEWAKLLKVRLEHRPEPDDAECDIAPAAAARIAARRLDHVRQILDVLRSRMPRHAF